MGTLYDESNVWVLLLFSLINIALKAHTLLYRFVLLEVTHWTAIKCSFVAPRWKTQTGSSVFLFSYFFSRRDLCRLLVFVSVSAHLGAVVYTGKESKVMLNSTAAPLKRSSVDKQTNYYVSLFQFHSSFACFLDELDHFYMHINCSIKSFFSQRVQKPMPSWQRGFIDATFFFKLEILLEARQVVLLFSVKPSPHWLNGVLLLLV